MVSSKSFFMHYCTKMNMDAQLLMHNEHWLLNIIIFKTRTTNAVVCAKALQQGCQHKENFGGTRKRIIDFDFSSNLNS